jgi:hypothetical protein
MNSERVRKRVLRLRKLLSGMPKDSPRRKGFENELSRLVTGKKPSRPVGTTVGVKQVRRIK